ncbi:hypothetical protein KY284_024217 [Solanum tuberosum]|nr:hypothetical protein KY284_024217 [Solanum tuberosum]
MYIARHVIFDEDKIPYPHYKTTSPFSNDDSPPSSLTSLQSISNFVPSVVASPSLADPPSSSSLSTQPLPTSLPSISSDTTSSPQNPCPTTVVSSTSSSYQNAPTYFRPATSSNHPMTTRAQTNSLKPKALTISRHPILVSSSLISEPKTYKQVASSPDWLCAMKAEYQALIRNRTWTLSPCPPNANVVGCKWVYPIKRQTDGSIERYKARLVAKGLQQAEGVDFHDTFSPVVKPSTIKLVLSHAVSKGWCLKQLDVNNAFLNSDLSEVVYMSQPPGFTDKSHPHFVCRLSKALYGLKQAPRAWFLKLKTFLISHGYTYCYSNSSLFVCHTPSSTTYLLVYVDDIILTGNDPSYISSFTKSLDLQFSLKDLGDLSFFLGIEVARMGSGILSQTSYIRDLLSRTKMTDCKPSPSPADNTFQLSKHSETFDDPSLYRSIVGALQYATIT